LALKEIKMTKPYRDCVVAVIRNQDGLVLAGERSDAKGAWQLPQGGVDDGESADQALFRELREEIGTDRLKVVHKLAEQIRYEFPPEMDSGPARKYRGQQQTWYLLELLPDGVPNLEIADGEFRDIKWMQPDLLVRGIVTWKQAAYRTGLKAMGLLS
jgi:putative (di)nucleoside polyphosphate hydrolase